DRGPVPGTVPVLTVYETAETLQSDCIVPIAESASPLCLHSVVLSTASDSGVLVNARRDWPSIGPWSNVPLSRLHSAVPRSGKPLQDCRARAHGSAMCKGLHPGNWRLLREACARPLARRSAPRVGAAMLSFASAAIQEVCSPRGAAPTRTPSRLRATSCR